MTGFSLCLYRYIDLYISLDKTSTIGYHGDPLVSAMFIHDVTSGYGTVAKCRTISAILIRRLWYRLKTTINENNLKKLDTKKKSFMSGGLQ